MLLRRSRGWWPRSLSVAWLCVGTFGWSIGWSPSAHAAEWFQWRGPERSGVVKTEIVKGANPSIEKVWEAEVGIGCSSMAIGNGRLYTVGHEDKKDTVFCFDAASGKKIWETTYPAELLATQYEGGPAATPTLDGNQLFVYSREGVLRAMDASTGKVLWDADVVKTLGGRPPRWSYSCSPLIDGNLVVVDVGGRNASTVAFDKANGKVVWKSGSSEAGYSSPIPMKVGGKERIAMFNEFGLVVLDPTSGKETARHRWETSYGVNAATPIVLKDGLVLISSGYGKGSAMLRVSDGGIQELWANDQLQSQFLSPVYDNGQIIGFDSNNKRLKALDAASGKVVWESKEYGKGGSVTVAGSTYIIMDELGKLALARPSGSGVQPLASITALRPRCWVAPAVSGDKIYVRNNRGDLVCLRVR